MIRVKQPNGNTPSHTPLRLPAHHPLQYEDQQHQYGQQEQRECRRTCNDARQI